MSSNQSSRRPLFNTPQAADTGRLFTLLTWLVVIGLVLLALPLYLITRGLDAQLVQLQQENDAIAARLTQAPIQSGTVTINPLPAEQLAELQQILPTLAAGRQDWPAVIAAIGQYNAVDLEITALEQSQNLLVIRGEARNEAAVQAYIAALESYPGFSAVLLQSLTGASQPFVPVNATDTPRPTSTGTAVPTATPTITPSPTATPGTPTPVPWDDYEWDDTTPGQIFVGSPQTHSFYPDYDVDQVIFLAKANRFYRVSTSALAVGVDTFLTVSIADTILTNDDAAAGTLASEIQFQAPAEDSNVLVKLSNRGPFGTDKTYQIIVEEIVPTATPIPTTAATATATVAPSATPDLRDIYEPDSPEAAVIGLGQVQVHNFFPQDDIDYLQVALKAGRYYEAQTSSLSVGVDTLLQATVDDTLFENDDYAPGTGTLASAVCFPAQADTTATLAVHQLGQLYTADQIYRVSIDEVPELVADTDLVDFGAVLANSGRYTETVNLSSSEPISWTATLTDTWATLVQESGSTPATLPVTLDSDLLAAGTYTTSLTLQWSTGCQLVIPLQAEVTTANSQLRPVVVAKPERLQETAVSFVIVVTLAEEGP